MILTRWTFDPNHELQCDEQWDNLHTLGPLCTTFSKYKISMKTKMILTKLKMVLVSRLVLGFKQHLGGWIWNYFNKFGVWFIHTC